MITVVVLNYKGVGGQGEGRQVKAESGQAEVKDGLSHYHKRREKMLSGAQLSFI